MPGQEYIAGRYLIRFAPRTIDDILALDDGREDERAFEVVERVSQINQGLYDTFASPVVKALSNEPSAKAQRLMNPVRTAALDALRPQPVDDVGEGMAESVREHRQPAADGQSVLELERAARSRSRTRSTGIATCATRSSSRRSRRSTSRPGWQAAGRAWDPEPRAAAARGPATWELEELERLKRKEIEAHREGDAARRLGAPAHLHSTAGRARRRAAVQPVPPHARGDEAGATGRLWMT